MLDWMNQIAHDKYYDNPERFRSMVSIDNPYLALLSNLLQMSNGWLKAHDSRLVRLRDSLIGESRETEACSNCFVYYKTCGGKKHTLERCRVVPLRRRPFAVLTLDGCTFMCQFGCLQVRSRDLLEMFRHFAQCHSYDELKEWGICKDLLLDTGPVKVKTPKAIKNE